MKQVSIIIPAYNEEAYIGQLLDSIGRIDYPKNLFEVIVVNDGSTDGTVEIVKAHPNVHLVDLPVNVGRYECRKKGAEAANFPNLLFIDAHSQADPKILCVLDQADAKVVNGRVEEAEPLGAFEVFYRAVRRRLYPDFYQDPRPFTLTIANFDSKLKGTGVLFIEKDILFSAYRDLAHTDMGKDASDDTKLLHAIVALAPILNHPDVKIKYFSRSSVWASIRHLYERGPKFVDYYLNPALRNFWLVIVFPLLCFAFALLGMIFLPIQVFYKISGVAVLDVFAALILSKTMREFSTILWVMPLSIAVFYAGILRGIGLKLFARPKHRA